ncbi:hypothetical protein SESBI_02346 [Sesbania bispinosa]|nr:hypothetical protein SESBI_02346 [Sesbania bispinosa]
MEWVLQLLQHRKLQRGNDETGMRINREAHSYGERNRETPSGSLSSTQRNNHYNTKQQL